MLFLAGVEPTAFRLGASPAFGSHYPSVFTGVHEIRVFPVFFRVL